MAAGIQLKNTLASNDAKIKQDYQQRWLGFPPDIRDYVKNNVSNFRIMEIYPSMLRDEQYFFITFSLRYLEH